MFFLFAGGTYYPAGGAGDYRGTFDSQQDAVAAGIALDLDWFEVATLKGRRLVVIETGEGPTPDLCQHLVKFPESPCRELAGDSGFCPVHDPSTAPQGEKESEWWD